jgi:hypothetical protein
MKPPVKDLRRRYISSQFHKELIPRGSVAETFVFYSGQLEFLLTDYERFVMAHTTRPPIHEFWACIQKDARRVYEILTSEIFKFDNENMFQILQETWGSYPNPYVRSALFFLMNTCSEQGLLSSGHLDITNFNKHSLNRLKTYEKPSNLFITLDKEEDLISTIVESNPTDFLVFPLPSYSYNLFEHGTSVGYEETRINHDRLFRKLDSLTKKWIVSYPYHEAAANLYKDYNQTLINKYGKPTTSIEACEEIVIANF